MKKGISFKFLISASALLVLTSCNDIQGGTSEPATTSEESITSLDTSSPDVSIGASSEIGGTSAPEEFSVKADYNTTVLQNAFEESMKKSGMRMVVNQPKIQLGLSTYTVLGTAPNFSLAKGSTNNILLQADHQTVEIKKGGLLSGTKARYNCDNLSLVAGAIGAIIPTSSFVNQDMNLYYNDDTLYWDFLDENGQECTGLSGLLDVALPALLSSASADATGFTFQHKGKIDLSEISLSESETSSLALSDIIDLLFSDLVTGMIWSSGIDPLIQSLWQGGAEITTTSSKVLGETVYDMSIKTSDPSVLLGGASDLSSSGAGSLVGGLTGSLPVDVSDATDSIAADYFSSFEFQFSQIHEHISQSDR